MPILKSSLDGGYIEIVVLIEQSPGFVLRHQVIRLSNPNTHKKRQEDRKFKVIIGYIVRLRPGTWAA